MTTPRLGIPELAENQSAKYLTHNEALQVLDVLVQTVVQDKDLTSPPAHNDGDVYIVASGATGAWAGQDNNFAQSLGGAWNFINVDEGFRAYVLDEQQAYLFEDAAWSPEGGGGGGGVSGTRVGYVLESPIFFYENKSVLLSGEDSLPQDVVLSNDSTKMFMLGFSNDTVYQYTLSTAGDLDTATYDGVSFTVAGGISSLFGLAFKPDGTKMYILARSNTSVRQYTLSTAWDLSTASYDSVSFGVGGQDTDPRALRFKDDDGTKMYVLGLSSNTAYEYDLSTAWDLSTAAYNTVSFSVNTQATDGQGFAFNGDFTKMFVLDDTASTIFRYTLSTAGDLSTASYDSFSVDVSDQAPGPVSLSFRSDGAKLYLTGGDNDTAYQYSASFVA